MLDWLDDHTFVQRVMVERQLMMITKTSDPAHGPVMQGRGLRGRERVLI